MEFNINFYKWCFVILVMVIPNGLMECEKGKSISREEIARKEMERLEELRRTSKELSELVVCENFLVQSVLGESHATSIYSTPVSFGSGACDQQGGYTSSYILGVSPQNKNIPVRRLIFNGNTLPRLGGLPIQAKIPRYRVEEVSDTSNLRLLNNEMIFYFDRDFNEEEIAIEISLLHSNWKEDYRAVEYGKFMKK